MPTASLRACQKSQAARLSRRSRTPLNQLLDRAFKEASNFKDEYVSTEHLLLAATQLKRDAAQEILARHGATYDAILKALTSVRGSQKVTDQNPEEKYQALERYTRDLTEQARRGKLDPVIGRDEEIRRVVQVLSRRTKNNPVLIGEPGRGQDRHCGRPGAAHHLRRCAGGAEEQARGCARSGCDAGGREISRRV